LYLVLSNIKAPVNTIVVPKPKIATLSPTKSHSHSNDKFFEAENINPDFIDHVLQWIIEILLFIKTCFKNNYLRCFASLFL
jgi:hypothetical protein